MNHGEKAIPAIVLLLLGLLAGCGKAPERQKMDSFFIDWLKAHGETNLVVDASGVGVAGNPTRLKASVYGLKQDAEGKFTAELEFRIKVPPNEEMIEFVVGMGKTPEEAKKDSQLNFLLTTFHVVYRSFMNPSDPHQTVRRVTVNGQAREVMMGDIYVRGATFKEEAEVDALRAEICAAICKLPLSSKPHWVKVVCGHVPGKPVMVSAALDNQDHEELSAALKGAKWPGPDQGYMLKEFIVVK